MTTDPSCTHPEFRGQIDVNWLEDTGAYSADVKIWCLECDEPFVFIGPLSGLSSKEVRVNIDGSELHAPIQPRSWGRTGVIGFTGFDVRPGSA